MQLIRQYFAPPNFSTYGTLLAGDFNLIPGIQWMEGCGKVSVNPSCGPKNNSLVNTINNNNLKKLVNGILFYSTQIQDSL